MPGLIPVSAPNMPQVATYDPAKATAAKAESYGYDPREVFVKDQDTVQGQVKQITSSGSPLITQAERRAREEANARGLISSSMAVGAGREAVYAAALPIAQQDATTHFQANTKNADAQNAAWHQSTQARNDASLANAQLGTDVSKTNAAAINTQGAQAAEASNTSALQTGLATLDAVTREKLAKLNITSQAQLAQLDADTRVQLASLDSSTRLQIATMDQMTRTALTVMENQYRQLIQANTSAANMYNQSVAAIGNISNNANLTPIAKDAAIKTQINMLNEGLKTTAAISAKDPGAVGSLNLSQFFQAATLTDPNATINAIQEQRFSLEQAVRNAQDEIPEWGGADYASYQAPPGPNQSERTAANFHALYAQKYQEYQRRVQELDAFDRKNAP